MKKTAFLKKLSAIILSVVMLLTALGGAISVSATDAGTEATGPVNILAGNTTGTLYSIALAEPYAQKQDFVKKTYDNLTACAASGDFVAWTQDTNDVDTDANVAEYLTYSTLGVTQQSLLSSLTTKDNTTKVRIDHTSGGDSALRYRAAIVYDLGAQYKLNDIKLTQDTAENIFLYNFSVYAGNSLDATIFENEIGNGGGNTAELTAGLNTDKSVRYVAITLDHVTQSFNFFVNMYGYKPTLTQIEIYGREEANVLAGNTNGALYRITLTEPYEQKQDFVKKTYDNLTACAASGDFVAWTQDINDFDADENVVEYLTYNNLGLTQQSLLNSLTTKDNTTKVRIDHTTGGDSSLRYRAAIVYDLGGYYKLDSIKLTQDTAESIFLYNFSVYAGDTLDATIFENEIGNGGGNTAVLSADLENNKSVRYVAITLDNVTQSFNFFVNMYGYKPTLTQIEIYGKEDANILTGNTTGSLYRLRFTETPMQQNVVYTPDYDTISYDLMQLTSLDQYSWRAQTMVDGAYATAADQATAMNLLTTANNTEKVRFCSGTGYTTQLAYRVAVLYDLGAKYDLSYLLLNIDNSACQIRNYSVYAGNTADLTLLDNCVGKGGSADSTATTLSTALNNAQRSRYVLIVFDHVTNQADGKANGYAGGYVPTLTGVKLYGENASLVAGNSGALYKTTFTEAPYTQGQDFEKKTYTTLEACAAGGDFVPYAQDVNDVDGDGYVTEYLTYSALGLTQDDVLTNLTTPGNTVKVRLDNTTGGTPSLSSRVGLLYDLGDSYNLDTLVLGQDISENVFVYNFSVYAGNSLDATIFENEIGNGGGTDKEMTVTLDDTVSARYVIIMIDHSTQSYNNFINLYGYKPTLTSVNFYGEKAEAPIEEVYGDMTSDETINILDYIALAKAIVSELEIDSAIADLNGDGFVNGNDLVVLKKLILGIEVLPSVELEVADPNLNDQGTDGTEAF